MTTHRRFLLASSIARLFRREFKSTQVTEGHFQASRERWAHVSITDERRDLISVTTGSGGEAVEERTAIPPTQAKLLLEVCAGKTEYTVTELGSVGLANLSILRFSGADGFDLVRVIMDDQAAADGFTPPVWAGPEISDDRRYETYQIALHGSPKTGEVPLSNAALNAALDFIEGQSSPRPLAYDDAVGADQIPERSVPLQGRAASLLQRLSAPPVASLPRAPRQLWGTNPSDSTVQQPSLPSGPGSPHPDWLTQDQPEDEDSSRQNLS